jgi:hypothetical protein
MAMDVLCEVNNCQFWKNGNRCGAESIYVVHNNVQSAVTSSETDCKTFIPIETDQFS